MREIFNIAGKRFLKVFVYGGIGSVSMLLIAGVSIHSLEDAKHVALILIGAFVAGGLAALEKAITSYIATQRAIEL